MPTRTGNFPIGFRRGWSDWQKNDLAALIQWAAVARFEAIDLTGTTTPGDIQAVTQAGLRLGSVDLLDFSKITAADAGERKDAMAANVRFIREAASWGATLFFTVVFGDPAKKRAENYTIAVDSYQPLAEAAAATNTRIVIEGWPGRAPALPNLCCTPETCRSFIRDTNPTSVGLNYDPSHLLRLGVDHIRFLKEFLPHVYHVHGKDTELMTEAAYEYGVYQPGIFDPPHGFGEHVWRYTIPGSGQTRWTAVSKILAAGGYQGIISVELEDEDFSGTESAEQGGLLHAQGFLRGI